MRRRAADSSNPCLFYRSILFHAAVLAYALTPFSALSRSDFLLVTFCRLLAFVFILALANLGTSFASAILAKDTTTSNGQLVDKNTNEVVATASAVKDYAVEKDDGDNARALQKSTNACVGDDNTATTDCDTNTLTATTMTKEKAQNMLKDCLAGRNVMLHSTSTTNGIETTTTMSICGMCSGSTFTKTKGQPTAGELCIQGSDDKLNVQVSSNNPSVYTLTRQVQVSQDACAEVRCSSTNPYCITDSGGAASCKECLIDANCNSCTGDFCATVVKYCCQNVCGFNECV